MAQSILRIIFLIVCIIGILKIWYSTIPNYTDEVKEKKMNPNAFKNNLCILFACLFFLVVVSIIINLLS